MKYDVEKIMADEICKKWVCLCMADNTIVPKKWFDEKHDYWKENSKHLEKFGFSYGNNITHALDSVLVEKIEDMEGCLLVVKIGTDDQPATATDVELACKVIEDALDGISGVRAIVSHHALDIKKINLPQLRKLKSEILSSKDPDFQGGLIIDNLGPI